MNISEVEVMRGRENIARAAKITQSSDYGNGQFPAQLLVDGNKDNFAHTAIEKDPWMKGEFSEPVEVSAFRVWNRKGFEKRFDGGTIEFFNGDDLVAAVDVAIKGGKGEGSSKPRQFGEV